MLAIGASAALLIIGASVEPIVGASAELPTIGASAEPADFAVSGVVSVCSIFDTCFQNFYEKNQRI